MLLPSCSGVAITRRTVSKRSRLRHSLRSRPSRMPGTQSTSAHSAEPMANPAISYKPPPKLGCRKYKPFHWRAPEDYSSDVYYGVAVRLQKGTINFSKFYTPRYVSPVGTVVPFRQLTRKARISLRASIYTSIYLFIYLVTCPCKQTNEQTNGRRGEAKAKEVSRSARLYVICIFLANRLEEALCVAGQF